MINKTQEILYIYKGNYRILNISLKKTCFMHLKITYLLEISYKNMKNI